MSDTSKPHEKRVDKLQIMVADSELQEIDNWRFDNRLPNRSSAIRSLIYLGMAYWEARPEEAMQALEAAVNHQTRKKLP